MGRTSTGAPLFVSLFGILAMLAGIAAIGIGGAILAEYDISIIPTQDLLTRLAVSKTILSAIFIVAGLLLLISGYGLRSLKFWAWLLFVLAFIATIAAFLYLDATLLVPGGILVAMAVIFGDLLAENEYFLKPEEEWPGTPDFVELLSYIVILIGLVAIAGGAGIYLKIGALTDRISPETVERAYYGPIQSVEAVGLVLAVIGIIILICGWGLKTTKTWAWILFLLVGIGVMALVFMTFPDITLPGAVLVVVSVILGDLIAEKQYFD
ncbi:MAG: hypothetical protein ACE5R6_11555 [Candidatus Heimdallarchaeota archaeon]